jgi:hypothetical protein
VVAWLVGVVRSADEGRSFIPEASHLGVIMVDSRHPWLAALLSVQPGLGHVYLREWLRAGSWLVLWTATLVLAARVATVESVADPAALVSSLLSLPDTAALALTVTIGFCMVDAYLLALRRGGSDDVLPSCPACGNDLDADLDFCHWCTERLE